jgi:hypothetical protein
MEVHVQNPEMGLLLGSLNALALLDIRMTRVVLTPTNVILRVVTRVKMEVNVLNPEVGLLLGSFSVIVLARGTMVQHVSLK